MRDDFARLFSKVVSVDPPTLLINAILAQIALRRRRAARIRLGLSVFVGTTALAALLPALVRLTSSVAESGFVKYLSLIGSDSDIALTYWHDLSFSILESLPVISLVAVLGVCFVLTLAIGITATHMRSAFTSPKMA